MTIDRGDGDVDYEARAILERKGGPHEIEHLAPRGRHRVKEDGALLPGMELMGCQGLAVPTEVMHHVVRVESSFNPYAIGVVGGRLVRQPKNLSEALSTVRMLESRGYNFSLGLAQVNRYNLDKYGLNSYERAFESCANLVAGSHILAECYRRSGGDWGKSFSCYYSGNFTTGYRHGYVQKIYASMRQGRDVDATPSGAPAIEVVARQARRTVPVSRYPLYADATAANIAGAVAAVPAEKPAAPSRIQSVPSRIASEPAYRTVESLPTQPVSPIASQPVQMAAAPQTASPSIAAATQDRAQIGAAAPVQLPANNAQAVALVAAPATVVANPSAVAASPSQAEPPRPRSARDPALVGGQSTEQDGAFVF